MIKFGTDGWRAVIAEDFTFENVKIVSQAIVEYLNKQSKKKKKVIIGYDTRFLSDKFAQTVACVLAANNIKVVLSDSCVPTPAVSFHVLYSKYDLGIMITASHNPAQFNGLKIKTKEGGSADKSLTDAVEKLLGKKKPKYIELVHAQKKKKIEICNLSSSYISFLRKFVDIKKIKKLKLRVLVDTMYGTGNRFAEKALGKCNVKIDYLHNEVNPSFGGINPEPVESNLKELIQKVKREKYDLGVCLDGDADRIAMIDAGGNYINAQVLLPLLAIHMVKNRKESGGIGKTVVGSNLIDEVALSLGAACYETPVGFKYLSNLFKDNLICIGGEEAGGIGFKGYVPERDGSAAFLLLLEMLAYEKRSFEALLVDLFSKYGRWFYARAAISVKSVKKGLDKLKLPTHLLGKKVERVNTLDGIKLITKNNWLMFRKSGTEPIVRVYAESRSVKESKELIALGEKMIYAL
jgi:alpha-D-glucose phosphate-specific phosphoglucomutase